MQATTREKPQCHNQDLTQTKKREEKKFGSQGSVHSTEVAKINEGKEFLVWISNLPRFFFFFNKSEMEKVLRPFLEKARNIYSGLLLTDSQDLTLSIPESSSPFSQLSPIPALSPNSYCLLPMDRGCLCTVPPQVPPSYLARIVALILISSTQHVFGKFGKFLKTLIPIHYGHGCFQQLSFHRLVET